MADYFLEGQQWAVGSTITWYYAGTPSSILANQHAVGLIAPDLFPSAILAAFNDWSSKADIHFQQVTDPSHADIVLNWGDTTSQGESDGVTFFPYTAENQILPHVQITFNDLDDWQLISGQDELPSGEPFEALVLHEIGHAVGLGHYMAAPAIMSPTFLPGVTDLTQSDIDGIQALYGPASSGIAGPPVVNANDVTVVEHASIPASSLVASISNPNGDAITQYVFVDLGDTSSHFELNGVPVGADGQSVEVDASALSSLHYVGGSSPGSETLDVAVYDATTGIFSNFTPLTATTTAGSDVNPENVYGSGGNDTIFGGASNDNINGGPGDDAIVGGAGDDSLGGGTGNDSISGGDGNDTMWGEAGNDNLGGNAGNDVIFGGDGNDVIGGDDGNDVLVGDDGNDTIFGGAGDDQISGGSGDDTLLGSDGNDTIWGNDGNDIINGGAGNDIVLGGNGDDQIGGGTGDDVLRGEAGNDTLWGEDGNDTLEGGPGDDILTGGAGHDTFVFRAGDGHDIITDFTPAGADSDQIWLAGTNLHSFADVVAHATYNAATGATTITHDGTDTIVLNGVHLTDLAAANFVFS